MLELSVKNQNGDILDFTHSKNYDVIKISGLTYVPSNINIKEIYGQDGGVYFGSQIGIRNIVITLNLKNDIEQSRVRLYKFFPEKQIIRLYITTETRSVYIDGYVETLEADLYSMIQQPQISIICPQPFFITKSEIELTHTETLSLFEFPFEFPIEKGIEFSTSSDSYDAYFVGGDVNSGIIFEITANLDFASVSAPKDLLISNVTTGQTMKLNNIYLRAGDVLYINTFKGNKQICIKRPDDIENALRYFSGDWPEITFGNNHISVYEDSGEFGLLIKAQAFQYFSGV